LSSMSHEVLDCWDADGYLLHSNGKCSAFVPASLIIIALCCMVTQCGTGIYVGHTEGETTLVIRSIQDTKADPLVLRLDTRNPICALHVSKAAVGA
jgi:hypothetical protein